MALQDIITNLGTAIINLVNVRISKAFTTHDSELEEILLDLKAKIDELVGDNTPDTPDIPPVITQQIEITGDYTLLFKEGFAFKHPQGSYDDIVLRADLPVNISGFCQDNGKVGMTGQYRFNGTEYEEDSNIIIMPGEPEPDFTIFCNTIYYTPVNETLYMELIGSNVVITKNCIELKSEKTENSCFEIQIENGKIIKVKDLSVSE